MTMNDIENNLNLEILGDHIDKLHNSIHTFYLTFPFDFT